jgi:glycosyltransferase involved in cell wall biosynthesis
MINVILLSPHYGNGGITSWTKKFIDNFKSNKFKIYPISQIASAKKCERTFIERLFAGISDLLYIKKKLKVITSDVRIDILHTTTSGSLGTIRDYIIAKYCKRNNIKSIMHCRYGAIPSIISKGGVKSSFLIYVMKQFDQVWVLDQKSYEILSTNEALKRKVFLTPNSIFVPKDLQIQSKSYRKAAFIANVLPSKGIFELIKAVTQIDSQFELNIVGPCNDDVLIEIIKLSGNCWGGKIKYLGKLPNDEAVQFLQTVDTLILPTYFPSEAFPISILEAMSYGKLVISTPRAAIPDMLRINNNEYCGLLVEEKNVEQLRDAIVYSFEHTEEMDELCRKAYQKAKNTYSMEVVYPMYESNYQLLISKNS